MQKLLFGYGAGHQEVILPEENLLGILTPNKVGTERIGEAEVKHALNAPISSPPLRNIVKPGEKIVIVTSDITRPLPSYKILPALLDELYSAGVRRDDITVVFALGIHRGHTEAERRALVGERVWNEVHCVDGDVNDLQHFGITTRGTPVDIVRVVAEADRRICLGNIEYHYFAGYSGGGKAIMPGVSTRAAIQNNHSHMVDASAYAGKLEGNPVREDIEEAAAMVGVDFIVNVVLDENKEIIRAVAGHPIRAHREGCKFLDKLYKKPIKAHADIVLVSQGGTPKDLNLYQTQKALDNAKHAVKKGGVIILIGSCKEGFGEEVFERWMMQAETAHAMIHDIQTNFELGGHKAAAIAMVLEKAEIYLVSELAPDLVRNVFLTPFQSAQAALDAAFKKLGKRATVLAMPYGGSTLPKAEIYNY